ncbi:hypothetical protein WN55_08826 [Dufourea novaeangliae]|uniref:Uncharacterized protein n=1 Tax=Dufourea novaeangliae TaxID=178035 RepID=A0A154NZX0_DUFNO|nr:hypothetical protein WN55_08826 [Dufourea novaeangliae]
MDKHGIEPESVEKYLSGATSGRFPDFLSTAQQRYLFSRKIDRRFKDPLHSFRRVSRERVHSFFRCRDSFPTDVKTIHAMVTVL